MRQHTCVDMYLIIRAMVFEEEDFQPVVYGYRLVPDVTETRALGMLREVEEELNRRLKTMRSRPAEEKNTETRAEVWATM